MSPEKVIELTGILKARFEKNTDRHKGLEWNKVMARLEGDAEKLWSINEMERTGGEPDVLGHDLKTLSWVKTPDEIRRLGGAIFCDRRYNTVFTYHNGAESYYASRGFRGLLRV